MQNQSESFHHFQIYPVNPILMKRTSQETAMHFRYSTLTHLICYLAASFFLVPLNLSASTSDPKPKNIQPSSALEGFDSLESPWEFTFNTNGKLWLWWSLKQDTAVTWDYGTSVYMEIARGHGHRLWYGGAYRLAAGFNAGQSITPFDPTQIDTWMYLSWRWSWKTRRTVFLHLRRTCYHMIDIHYSSAVFWTHAAFGIGTTSPIEVGEQGIRVRQAKKAMFDMYFSTGPFVHGGISRVFGHNPTYQWESSLYCAYTFPVTGTFLMETGGHLDVLNLLPNDGNRTRYRLYLRHYFIAQRARGHASLFIDRLLHDDYIDRRSPVTWRVGLEHRF